MAWPLIFIIFLGGDDGGVPFHASDDGAVTIN